MKRFMQSKHLAVVAACIWASTLADSPAAAQQPDSLRVDGTFTMALNYGQVGPDLAAIVARGESHTWTLTLDGLSYSHDDEVVISDPDDYYARSITRLYATSFDFQFQGPDADALNAIISDRLVNGGLQDEPFLELQNVTYYEPGWGAILQARAWVITIQPLDYLQGFRFYSSSNGLEFPAYTKDANGYPVLESGVWGAWVQITDRRPGYDGGIGSYGENIVSVSLPLPGDFNYDGAVDAADYVLWRKGVGTTYDQNDYGVWRAHFGASLGPGSGSAGYPLGASAEPLSAAVPEPAALALVLISAALWPLRLRPAKKFSRNWPPLMLR